MADKEPLKLPMMPVIHTGQYTYLDKSDVTVDMKAEFLKMFYETGNETLAARHCKKSLPSVKYHLKLDPMFALDYQTVKDAMKHNLEETMYQNALTPRGFMDRMAWLRKHYPQEYNPNADHSKDPQSKDVIQELANKLKGYEVIPKKDIVDIKE